MKRFLILFIFVTFYSLLNAQLKITDRITKDGAGFNSIFQNVESGLCSGSLSGVLYLQKNKSDKPTIYNFQKENASLNIVYDPDTVYDVSTKNYLFKRSDIQIRYSTYFYSNCFEIILNSDTCRFDVIDGGCDLVIRDFEWTYSLNEDRELLYLYAVKDFGLWRKKWADLSDYVVKAGSLLCFEIYRKK